MVHDGITNDLRKESQEKESVRGYTLYESLIAN